jgi:hypothetical protein
VKPLSVHTICSDSSSRRIIIIFGSQRVESGGRARRRRGSKSRERVMNGISRSSWVSVGQRFGCCMDMEKR